MRFTKLQRLSLFCLLFTVPCLVVCVNTRNLADLDLGSERKIKIYTGWTETTLPIYCELFINGKSVDKSVIEYEETFEYKIINQYRYEVLSDESKQVFVIVRIAPNLEAEPQITLDFNTNFGYPVCPVARCLDCHNGYCNGNNQKCFTKFNQILSTIEAEHSDVRLKRIALAAISDCSK